MVDYLPEKLQDYTSFDEIIDSLYFNLRHYRRERLQSEIIENVPEIEERLTAIEEQLKTLRTDEGVVYDDADVFLKIKELSDEIATITQYDDTAIKQRITALENREAPSYDDTELERRIEALETRDNNGSVYDDTEVRGLIEAEKRRIDALVTDPKPPTVNLQPIENRLTLLEQKEDSDTVYDDTDIKARLQVLEQKTDNDTIYDDTDIKARIQVLEQKTDNDTVYDDTDIKERLQVLEQKEDADTIYDDAVIKARLQVLEQSKGSEGGTERPTWVTVNGVDYIILNKVTKAQIKEGPFRVQYVTTEEIQAGAITLKPNTLYYKHSFNSIPEESLNTVHRVMPASSVATVEKYELNNLELNVNKVLNPVAITLRGDHWSATKGKTLNVGQGFNALHELSGYRKTTDGSILIYIGVSEGDYGRYSMPSQLTLEGKKYNVEYYAGTYNWGDYTYTIDSKVLIDPIDSMGLINSSTLILRLREVEAPADDPIEVSFPE